MSGTAYLRPSLALLHSLATDAYLCHECSCVTPRICLLAQQSVTMGLRKYSDVIAIATASTRCLCQGAAPVMQSSSE